MSAPYQPSVICQTRRLILRPTTIDDLKFIAAMNTDPVVCRFLGGVKTSEQSRQKIDEAIEHQRQHGFSRWTVLLKNTGEPIGRCGPMVKHVGGAAEVELGYAFTQGQRMKAGRAWRLITPGGRAFKATLVKRL